MSSPADQEPPSGLTFGTFLAVCMENGIRPEASRARWEKKHFAGALRKTTRQLEYWLRDEHLPRSTAGIEGALFGQDPNSGLAWRSELRQSLERTRKSKLTSPNQEAQKDQRKGQELGRATEMAPTLRDALQKLAGGALFAVGMIHLAWLGSEVSSTGTQEILRDPWAYSDFVFGVGGVLVGAGTLLGRNWARLSGISLAVLGVITSYLWFVDFAGIPITDVVYATNVITSSLSVVGVFFFLFGWPESKQT